MFENIMNFFKRANKKEGKVANNSKTAAKERLHLVLMQDRANVSADFLELMKQEIIEVIKKYIDIDEGAIDVRLTNKENEDGTNGAPALYANIPILNIKNEARKMEKKENNKEDKKEEQKSDDKEKEEKQKTADNSDKNLEKDNKNEKSEDNKEKSGKEESNKKQDTTKTEALKEENKENTNKEQIAKVEDKKEEKNNKEQATEKEENKEQNAESKH